YQDFNGGPVAFRGSKGTQDSFDVGNSKMEADHAQEYYVLPLWSSYTSTVKSSKIKNGDEKLNEDIDSKINEEKTFAQSTEDLLLQAGTARANSTNYVNTTSTPVNAASTPLNTASTLTNQDDSQIPSLKDIYEVSRDGIFTSASYDDEGAVADFTNLETTMNALKDESWVNAMQEELVQFKIQKVWILVDLPFEKKAIRTKWVYRNKKDERGVVRNKARLVAQGHRQEEGIDYDEVFALVARIKAISIFLAFASYMGFIVSQIDVKSAFLYGKIDEKVYVSQPPGFIDPKFPNKVYKVVKALYGLHQARKACVKTASTPIEKKKPLVKDKEAADVDVHLYRSKIGSLMYLSDSRPNIMYAVYAWSRESVFDLEAYLDSDYAGANLDMKSTTIEYGAVVSYCRQVLWIQNQMLDYDFNFMNTKIYIDNESTIFIVKNPMFHSKTKHTETRHHFIRDAYEKKLIQVLKIHTDDNVADLLTKTFDVSSSQTLNDEKQIHATIDSKEVVVTEASIRSSLLFNDADGTACLTNEAIFQNLALVGYE
nr:putative ribonuclease H-like domain-containing protein [Tanacetum cinerariifolium]